ncbi:BTB/POZ domain-containing protein KCTD7-like [Watersipora subatra]|uniref:BTB/POZ domain-containing protein KCTD7-like n=1 Tax=Watersipora subatra TaxID=2589382 RepID=UPI00355BAD9E
MEEDLLEEIEEIPQSSGTSNKNSVTQAKSVSQIKSVPQSPGAPKTVNTHHPHTSGKSFKAVQGDSTITAFDKLSVTESPKLPPVVTLNVGGVYFTTLRTTLLSCPGSKLTSMFNGDINLNLDQRGAYFIDRSGTYFGYILEFLRTGTLPPDDVAPSVLLEAKYYTLSELIQSMNTLPSISAQIVRVNHRAQFPDYEENKRRVVQIAMENATVTKTGDVIIFAFRTEFVPKAPNFNMNHHCSADQAHISIGPWESIADEETLIKCIQSDLIDEHFNVILHEGKRRCKYFYGQSCQKCTFRIQVVFG